MDHTKHSVSFIRDFERGVLRVLAGSRDLFGQQAGMLFRCVKAWHVDAMPVPDERASMPQMEMVPGHRAVGSSRQTAIGE